MNQTLTSLTISLIPRFLLLLLGMLFSFQQGNAQHHCSPTFHFTTDGNTVIFDDQSTADGNITGYEWDFGDSKTSSEQNPTHTYAVSGTYNVCLTITAHNPNCTATFCHHVVVNHPPLAVCHAAFSAHQPDPAQSTIAFTDQSTSDGIIGSWVWNFGDGNTSTEQNPSHIYAHPGTYQVCLTITDATGSCTNHLCHDVVVHHPPVNECHAAFAFHYIAGNLGVQFTNTSTGATDHTTYAWDFGENTISNEENPTYTYSHFGHYTVCLTIADTTTGCSSHFCHHMNIHHNDGHHHPHDKQFGRIAAPDSDRSSERSGLSSELMTIYPNPVVGTANIFYQIHDTAMVKFDLYSLVGIKVGSLPEKVRTTGEYTEVIPVGNLLSGVYFLKMTIDGVPYFRELTVQ